MSGYTAMAIQIIQIAPDAEAFPAFLQATDTLNQTKYIHLDQDYYEDSILITACDNATCVGFLRLVIQIIGRDQGRPPIYRDGIPLREGYVEAFGVLPEYRRQGIGQQMQEYAISLCRTRDCYQIRSRSPHTSAENYALKLKMGYAIQPSNENDSYYFIKPL
jgi:GNAT superfamily N-acetyltransferase